MDVFVTEDYYRFVYDPWLYGYNTAYWRGLNGTPIVNASQQIQLQSVTIVSKHQYFRGDFVINLTIPTAPSAGDNRTFGLLIPAEQTKNSAYFQIQGTTFQGVVNDSFNGTQTIVPLTWNTAWNSTPTEFRILWNGREIQFFGGGVFLGTLADRNKVPQLTTVPIYISNNNNDAMLLSYLNVSNVHKVVMPTWETTDLEPDNVFRITSVKDATTTAEAVTMLVTDGGMNIVDSTVTSEFINMNVGNNPNVSDSTSTSESIGVNKYFPINVNDATTTSESITPNVPNFTVQPNVSDSTATSESANAHLS